MSNFTPYLERNQAFAASGAQADVPRIPFIANRMTLCAMPGAGARSRRRSAPSPWARRSRTSNRNCSTQMTAS